MDATTITDIGGKPIRVEGLVGRLLGLPNQMQPVGEDTKQWIPRAIDLQIHGFSIHWTPYRPSDITGRFPVWREFSFNVGDIDFAPVGIPMGPRHFKIPGTNFRYNPRGQTPPGEQGIAY